MKIFLVTTNYVHRNVCACRCLISSKGSQVILFPPRRSFYSYVLLSSKTDFLRSASGTYSEYRFVRTYKQPEPGPEKDEPNNSSSSQQNGEEQKPQWQSDPKTVRKLRIYVLIVASVSFVMSFFVFAQMITGERKISQGLTDEHLKRPGIEFRAFADKYLRSGEVQRITFVPSSSRAFAHLYSGAIIDGKNVSENVVVVNYPHTSQQFWADIRKEEAELGISLAQGVQIDLYQGMTTFRMIELALGILIVAWIGTQYGRLLRKRFLENQRKTKGP